jgi:hypothetical protein
VGTRGGARARLDAGAPRLAIPGWILVALPGSPLLRPDHRLVRWPWTSLSGALGTAAAYLIVFPLRDWIGGYPERAVESLSRVPILMIIGGVGGFLYSAVLRRHSSGSSGTAAAGAGGIPQRCRTSSQTDRS